MRTSAVWGLVCLVGVLTTSPALADADYYQALKYAEHAADAAQYEAALRIVDAALHKYWGDYELTLARARLQLRLGRYAAAEQTYRSAVAISDGSPDARLGLGWVLQIQGDCEAATQEFQAVLRAAPDADAALRGMELCRARSRMHGSFWLIAGGALFQDHPWKRRFEDASAGFTLQPGGPFTLGLAYHQLHLTATDRRVAGVDQHEVYLQAGFMSGRFQLLGHGALVWSQNPNTDGSTHAGLSGRYHALGQLIEDVSAEVAVSRYPDMWVGRFATAWRFAVNAWSITPGLGVIRVGTKTLTAVSLSLGRSIGALSLWVGGKYGPEYRAAYLPQFALLNSADTSLWSVTGGARVALDEHWLLLAGYFYLRMRTPDGLSAGMHLINVGTIYIF